MAIELINGATMSDWLGVPFQSVTITRVSSRLTVVVVVVRNA